MGTTNACELSNVTATLSATFALLAAAPAKVAPVPSLGAWALLLSGLGTAAFGAQRIRCRG